MVISFTGCTGSDSSPEQMVDLERATDDYHARLAALNEAISNSKQNAGLYARRAVLYLKQHELQKALADANDAVRLSKNEPSNLFIKAQVLRSLKQEGEALTLALQAERNGYRNALLYVLLSDLYLQLQQPNKAREYNNLAYSLSPKDEYVLYYRGRIAAAAKDTATAIKFYKEAVQEGTDFFEPHRELAGIFTLGKNLDAAGNYIQEAQKQNNKDGLLWYYRGRFYQSTEKPDSALWSYNKAVTLADSLKDAHSRLGYLYYARGNNEKAITHLTKAKSDGMNLVRFYTTLANIYERTGQYQQALEQYERLVNLEPGYTYAHQSITRLKSRFTTTVADSTSVQEDIEE